MAHMKKHHRKHHSDPIVGGESEAEGRVWGQGEHANMPKDVKFENYPKANEAGPMILDDTQGHINKVQKQGKERVHTYMSNQH